MEFLNTVWNWVFDYLGLFRVTNIFKKQGTLLFLGLDNAGKTTLFGALKNGRVSSSTPTQRPSSDDMTYGKIFFKAFDIGGHEAARSLWRDYSHNASAVVFMIDATDTGRFHESMQELKKLLDMEEFKNVPFLLLANKIDKQGAVSREQMMSVLNASLIYTTGTVQANSAEPIRPMELFMCSVVNGAGYGDGIRWLVQYL